MIFYAISLHIYLFTKTKKKINVNQIMITNQPKSSAFVRSIKNFFKSLILNTPLENIVRRILRRPHVVFLNSSQYWDQRYFLKGNSGPGSYGRLANFKAEIINEFVKNYQINSVIEFGCGDGNQLALACYPSYVGMDVSKTAIDQCINKFSNDKTKRFLITSDYKGEIAECSMSLDVIYHLVEDDNYIGYMTMLFNAASKFVIIYASNYDDDIYNASHVRHRRFTDWVKENMPQFQLLEKIPNRYPYEEQNPDHTSLADFYIYKRV